MNIILASKSPRRSQLLQEAGLDFEVVVREVEEIYPPDLLPSVVPAYLAELKSAAFSAEIKKGEVVITADTIVILDEQILGKPKDKEDAYRTLRLLSGKRHEVVTGVCLLSQAEKKVFSESTFVSFYELSDALIEHYVEKYQPFDKAGSYAIQEWIGLVSIERIEGNYSNVLGLPVAQLLRALKGFGVDFL